MLSRSPRAAAAPRPSPHRMRARSSRSARTVWYRSTRLVAACGSYDSRRSRRHPGRAPRHLRGSGGRRRGGDRTWPPHRDETSTVTGPVAGKPFARAGVARSGGLPPLMREELPSIAFLRAFSRAAETLSLKEAAADLNLSPSAVSRQIQSLEAHLGVMLFRRLNPGLEVTEAGLRYLE